MGAWKIKVVWPDGSEEFVQEGSKAGKDARFTKSQAEALKDFMLIGMAETQSINVVRAERR